MSAWGPYGGKSNQKGKGRHGWERSVGESWAMSGEAMQELSNGESFERGVPSMAPGVGLPTPGHRLRPHPPPGPPTFLRVKEEPKLEPSSSSVSEVSGLASFEPSTRPPAIGDAARASYLQSLKKWLRGNLSVVELENLMT